MKTKVSRWGNSLGVRIPQALAESIGLAPDTTVEISAIDQSIVIKPISTKPTLRDLVKQISADNIHTETDWGKPSGREVW